MPRYEQWCNPEQPDQKGARRKERQIRADRGRIQKTDIIYAKTVGDVPRKPNVTARIDTTLKQLGGHHGLLGGSAELRSEEIKTHIIASEDIPEGYYQNQQRIAREQGHGNIEITPEVRREAGRVIRGDQEASLNHWVQYLNDPTATYPEEFKYFVLRNVLSMGVYDKENARYGKRSKGTTAPYP